MRAGEPCVVERDDSALNLFDARTETAYPGRSILLRLEEERGRFSIEGIKIFVSDLASTTTTQAENGARTRRATLACSMASHGAGRSRNTSVKNEEEKEGEGSTKLYPRAWEITKRTYQNRQCRLR